MPDSSRRSFLRLTGSAATAALLAPRAGFGAAPATPAVRGAVAGNVDAAKVGEQVLKDGGNAIDAAIASAFAACVCSPLNCGLGGYGGHAIIGLAGGKKITAIDFNSTAPAAARPDMYRLEANGRVQGGANTVGWLAAGVPGTLAGLELALTRYGTRSLRDTLAPAIALCEQGTFATAVKGIDDVPGDVIPGVDASLPREKQRNAAQLRFLRTLASRNSTDSFYRGDLAATLADSFQRHGGLVTREDLAAFRAREVAPVSLECFGHTLHTAPLPASGALVLEALAIVAQLDLPGLDPLAQTHTKLEALRIAWTDRLATWGDPDFVSVPLEKLLSSAHVAAAADKVRTAVRTQKPVPLQTEPTRGQGTINLSAADAQGNMIAITLTHGGGYGARVVVPEFGIFLGHGMSRFDPRPGLPNSVGPRKRPITNMCPTLVTRAGVPVFAVGGAGGTRIPSNVFEVLAQTLAHRSPLADALAKPRIDTTGTLEVNLAKGHGQAEEEYFRRAGFVVKRTPSATISGATFDPASRATAAAARSV